MTFSLALEVLFAASLVLLTGLVWRFGKSAGFSREPGFRWILAGFGLIILGGLVDITDHFPSLGRYLVLGQTPGQAVLEKVIGFLGGVVVLAIGLARWLPVVADKNRKARDAERMRTSVQRRLDSFFSLALELLCIADFEGYFQDVNPSFSKLLGWSVGELKSQPFLNFVHPDDLEATLAEMDKLGQGEDTLYFENRYRCKDGSYRWLAWNAHAEPEVGRIYAAAHDITPLKATQKELELARDQAQASSEAKSDFLAKMSHELRTPLNSVIGFANVLLARSEPSTDEDERVYLDRIRANGTHLLALINDVLDISRIEAQRVALNLEPVDVVELARECLREMEPRVKDGRVRLGAEVPAREIEPVTADRRRLKQVMLNLVDNALKFTTEGAVTLRIVARRRDSTPVRVEVEDSGPGIAETDLPKIFDAFHQVGQGLGRRHQGTGLGLPISKSLCDLMGFRLEATSQIGVGSTFSIALTPPLGSGEFVVSQVITPVGAEGLAELSLGHLVGRTVLVIDDQAEAREILLHALRKVEIRTLEAESIAGALARLENGERPDAITVDLLMSDGGVEGIAMLAADPRVQGVPILVISIVADDYQTQLPSAAAVLPKPVNQEELITRLAELIPV